MHTRLPVNATLSVYRDNILARLSAMTCWNVLTSLLVTWLVMGTSLLGGTKSFTLLVCRSSSVILSSLPADAIDAVSSSLVPVGSVCDGPVAGSEVGFDGSGF